MGQKHGSTREPHLPVSRDINSSTPAASCRFCGQPAPLLFTARDYNRQTSAEAFRYHRCGACGLIFVSPVPSSLGRYYPTDYYSIPAKMTNDTPGVAEERYKVDIVAKVASPGARLLEIGPSWGQFLFLAKQAGYQPEAIEMDARCTEFLRDVVDVPAICSSDPVAVLRASDKMYDVIALWHVIEHLPDALGFLTAACARLNPGGTLVIAAPNPTAWQFSIFGRYWAHLDAPRHLQLIPASLLAERCREFGLEELFVVTDDPGGTHWNRFGWEWSLVNLAFHGRGKFRGAGRLKAGVRRVGALLDRLFRARENCELRGSAYTVALRKQTLAHAPQPSA